MYFLVNPDLIIISTAHSKYKSDDFITKLMGIKDCKIFDAVGLLSNKQISYLRKNMKFQFSVVVKF